MSRIVLPGTEEPHEDEDGVINYFMESLKRIDPFILLQNPRNRILINRKMLLEEGEEKEDLPEAPPEPLGMSRSIPEIVSEGFPGWRWGYDIGRVNTDDLVLYPKEWADELGRPNDEGFFSSQGDTPWNEFNLITVEEYVSDYKVPNRRR